MFASFSKFPISSQFQGLHDHTAILITKEFGPKFTEFPQDVRVADAVAFVLENTCLVGDLLLHFPDICYRILRGNKTWYGLVNWNLNFTRKAEAVVDDLSMKMLNLLNQELNEDQRGADYVNPYLEANQKKPELPKSAQKKPRKKLKKGPALSSKQEL